MQGYEQLVEFVSMDRNHDGIISAGELELARRMKGNGNQGANSSLVANCPPSTRPSMAAAAGRFSTTISRQPARPSTRYPACRRSDAAARRLDARPRARRLVQHRLRPAGA